jgi:hypothetical protein
MPILMLLDFAAFVVFALVEDFAAFAGLRSAT